MKNKPEEYEADSKLLWNDEHISKGMLQAHHLGQSLLIEELTGANGFSNFKGPL